MAAIMLMFAYILPLPLVVGCLYFHLYENMELTQRLVAIGLTSVVPSALLMIFALKRIVHTIFQLAIVAAVLFGLYHFGLIGQAAQ